MKKFTKTSIWVEKEKKLCSICDEIKHISEFHKCSRGGVQSACKPCRSEYQKELRRNKVFENIEIKPILNLEGEIWKTINGYENYEISNHGRVKIKQHFDRKSNFQEIIKKSFVDEKGYHRATLWKNSKMGSFAVHRLVALYFIPNLENLPTVHHIDYNPSNNHISNLEWRTVKDNCGDIINRKDVYTKRESCPKLRFDYSQMPAFLTDKNFNPKDEVWKNINDLFQISNYGRLRNLKTLKLRKPWKDPDNYLQYSIENVGRKSIHKLVIEYFIPNTDNLPITNHKDGNKFNNHVSNLEWVSHKRSIQHAVEIGLRVVGENHGFAKLKEKEVLEIRKLHQEGLSINKIRKIYKVSNRTIGNIVKRRNWVHI